MIGCYCRVSTADQNLDRQLEATSEYAQNQLGAEPADIEVYRDRSTGTDTARDGYRSLIESVEAGEIEMVVSKSVSRIARSIRDLDRTAERVTEAGAELHIIDEGLVMQPDAEEPYQNALFRLLGVFAQLEAELAQQRTREGIAARKAEEGYHHGRPPLGFESANGQLVEAANYDQVVSVLELVRKGELSKRAAARELETSRPTIDRAIDRGALYGI